MEIFIYILLTEILITILADIDCGRSRSEFLIMVTFDYDGTNTDIIYIGVVLKTSTSFSGSVPNVERNNFC